MQITKSISRKRVYRVYNGFYLLIAPPFVTVFRQTKWKFHKDLLHKPQAKLAIVIRARVNILHVRNAQKY